MKEKTLSEILKDHLKPIVVGGIFLFAYLPTIMWMWDRWFVRDSYYSHGVLIPFVTGYFIWQEREALKKITPSESRLGLPLLVLGLLIYMVSSILRINFTAGFSFLITLVGFVLYFYGRPIFRKISFPILFLFFMIPMPEVVISNASFKLKIFAAQIAAILLNNMGLAAVRSGSNIMMQHTYVTVDDVCSGLRSLISLTALGSIFAYWMKGSWWKRAIVFLSTIPIAIITNVCRVIVLSCISEIWGPQYAVGFIHDATGFMVFGLAFVLLLGVHKLLESEIK
jgi:exosortase